jgi:hypothetical protein
MTTVLSWMINGAKGLAVAAGCCALLAMVDDDLSRERRMHRSRNLLLTAAGMAASNAVLALSCKSSQISEEDRCWAEARFIAALVQSGDAIVLNGRVVPAQWPLPVQDQSNQAGSH